MSDKCPSCGVDYIDHLGLIGACYRLNEAINTVGELEKRIADISTDWIVNQEKLKVMREALVAIARTSEAVGGGAVDMRVIAKQALRQTGGDSHETKSAV